MISMASIREVDRVGKALQNHAPNWPLHFREAIWVNLDSLNGINQCRGKQCPKSLLLF